MKPHYEEPKAPYSDLECFYQATEGNLYTVIQQLGVTDDMLKKFLKKFLANKSFIGLERALSEGDVKTAFLEAHTLKGIAANLGLQKLFHTASVITEFLRAENIKDAEIEMSVLREQYNTICELIKKLN